MKNKEKLVISQVIEVYKERAMEQAYFDNGLMDRLPIVRGSLVANGNLSNQTWFRVGGPAEVLFRPYDVEDLSYLLSNCPEDVPVTVLGNASNVLVRDGGIPGVVIRLGPNFANITVGEDWIKAGGGSSNYNVAKIAQVNGLAGIEWISGIPGTIGGGVKMNAGAYGKEVKDVLMYAKIMDRRGRMEEYMADELGLRYRRSDVSDDSIVTEAMLKVESGDREQIRLKMNEIKEKRLKTQPIGQKTAGSTFVNPEGETEGRKSWQLIEAAGCRGLKIGQAKVSERHCNFLINTGRASAKEIEDLGEEIRKRVFEKFGIKLRWEVKILGQELQDE